MPSFAVLPISTAGNLHLFSVKSADLNLRFEKKKSDGEKVANPKQFNRLYKKLRRKQKALSRKTKGSNNRYKACLEVAKVHAQIKDARSDFLHKLTTRLVRENDLIAIEDLAVRNMVKNPKLARAISDASWGEFNRQLEYKCEWYGKELVKIDRYCPSNLSSI